MSDAFVLTSTAENYPMVCQEAQNCGTPVVEIDVDGVSMTIQEGTGVCVVGFDVQAMQYQTPSSIGAI